jgi:hypothetical protein
MIEEAVSYRIRRQAGANLPPGIDARVVAASPAKREPSAGSTFSPESSNLRRGRCTAVV